MRIFPAKKRLAAGLCAGLMVFCLFSAVKPILAAAAGSITINYGLSGVNFRLYRVADADGGLTTEFKDSGVDVENTTAAGELANYVSSRSISADREDATGTAETAGGKYSVNFSGLAQGVYLVVGESKRVNSSTYTPTSALVLISQTSLSDDTSLNAVVEPKTGIKNNNGGGGGSSITDVTDPVGGGNTDPGIVDIGGEDIDTVNSGNDETVNTVNSAPPGDDTILDDDTVTTVKSAQNPIGSRLPQTGQLWWPVIALSAAGLCSLTIGVRRRKNK
jgi:LPXTG-motif cell wall-anchored protein